MRSSFSSTLRLWGIRVTLMAMTSLHAAPGDLDTSFGAGVARHTLGGDDQARGVHVFSDGSMLVGGFTDRSTGNYDFTLTRFTSVGQVDTSFGTSGTVRTEVRTGNDRVRDMLRLSDGRILLAGDSRNASNYDLALVCHQAGGSLDTTFGTGGRAVVSISSRDDFLSRVIESNGKILAVGYTYTDGGSPAAGDDLIVVRWNANGSLDTSFNGTGYLVLDIFAKPEYGRAIHVLQNGDMLVLGEVLTGSNRDAFLVKLNSNGQIVTSFNGTGHVLIDQAQAPEIAFDMKVQTDGKILMAGWRNTGSGNDFALARYQATGVPDITFNNTGFVTTSLSKTGAEADQAYAIALQTDGRIIVAGSASGGGAMGVVRYMPDGTLDGTFNSNGHFLIDGTPMPGLNANGNLVIPVGTSAQLRDVMLLADGGLVAVGQAHNGVNNDLLITRLDSSGKLDSSFGGTSGKVTTAVNSGGEVIYDLALAADGKIIAVGHGQNGATRDFTVARYLRNGFLDVTFGTNGKVQTPIGSGDDDAEAVAIQSDGKIVVAGHTVTAARGWDIAVARYNTDGSLDTTFGSGGKMTPSSLGSDARDEYARRVVIDSTGRIFVLYEGIPHLGMGTTHFKMQLLCLTNTGAADPSFGFGGWASVDFGSGHNLPRAMTLQPDGRILVAGLADGIGGYDFALARLTTSGALDSTFGGGDGKLTVDVGGRDDIARSVIVQSTGRIVVGGHASSGGGPYSFMQLGFDSSGNLDNTFDTDAVVLVPGRSGGALGFAMAVQPDNRIVMAGASISSSEDFGLFRVQANGALDSSFGTAGKVVTPIGGGNDRAYACVIQPDGKIIAAGHAWNGSNDDFALVRYLTDVPTVVTGTATAISKTTATLQGNVSPKGVHLNAYFEYGLSTSYGSITSVQSVSGAVSSLGLQAGLTGLLPNSTYHYRLVVSNGTERFYGGNSTFNTQSDPPIAATLSATDVSRTSASLLGVVLRDTYVTKAKFEYWATAGGSTFTQEQDVPVGNGFFEVKHDINGLTPETTYHFRLVASRTGGTTLGGTSTFTAQSNETPERPPEVITGTATGITSESANLSRAVNPRFGTTRSWFDYGLTTAYGSSSAPWTNLGNGGEWVQSHVTLSGLLPGTTYHYRAVAFNDLGTTYGSDMFFTTQFLPPMAATGSATAASTTSALLQAVVNGRGSSTRVFFDHSLDGVNFTYTDASPSSVTGNTDRSVSLVLNGLGQGTYHYRVRAVNSDGTVSLGNIATFRLDTLLGLNQAFPGPPPESEGFLTVNLMPEHILHGWRFVGEQQWRLSGLPVAGLTTSNREIEFRPVPGYIQPPPEPVSIISGEPVPPFNFEYISSSATGSGGLVITLKPDNLTTGTGRAQWRLLGENDTQWRDSDMPLTGLIPGSYLVECKPVTGRATPPNVNVTVVNGQTAASTITYFLPDAATGTPPAVLSFESITTDTSKPYAYVGQIRSTVGSSTGFVVKPRVVATAAHVVWDDGTLASLPRVEWLFQRYRGTHEPEALILRGHYTFDGYAAQRIADNSPGDSSPKSQHLDVAAIYFNQAAGRGGYSGFLASDLSNNEFLLSNANKMLVGYPMDGIIATSQGRMHATAPFNVVFNPGYNKLEGPHAGVRTFTTSNIRSSGGNSGGPLCVQFEGGAYYPAAIYLGGDNQTVVRAIDSQVIDLFNRAEISSNGGGNQTNGGITRTEISGVSSSATGNVQVFIEPPQARAVVDALGRQLARWRVNSDSYRESGAVRSSLAPKAYDLNLTTIAGFQAPTPQTITVIAGQQTTITYTYAPLMTPQESWRQTHFGTMANTGNAADTFDYDNDGFTNSQEYAAGTNPTLPGDFFKVTNAQRTASTFTAGTAGKAGRTYTLQRSTNLTSWTAVGSPQGPLASDGPVTLQDTAMPNGAAFYRIVVAGP